ncbi:outer membrane lipoprotein carrier protein LolA [Parvularcula maris]|uniref:Outer membrane lipoprotein carrier protein LolA n=1 Tax=Parvularcula maris TaxID=2965077 RepID=A0A9X2L899_9PROT|nr:outer membrane lipoprotein carrier protein LolA [Parvularcula maris]MCQ8183982.1 outer membrane lipoprotein carrier protein LolA [Parvularcula maris]
MLLRSLPLVLLAAAAAMVGVPTARVAAQDEASSERSMGLLQEAAAGLEAIRNLEASFTQFAPDGQISKGRFYLSRPGRLRFEYDDPNPMLIVATGGLVYIHDEELESTSSYPVGQTPLRFLLSKELDLEAAQVISVREDQHGIKIELEARDEDLRGRLALLFESETLTLSGWSFVDPAGQMTLVSLEDVEAKKRLSGRLFRVPEAGGSFLSDN